jgi:cytochrome c-type biogenesis protein CcmH
MVLAGCFVYAAVAGGLYLGISAKNGGGTVSGTAITAISGSAMPDNAMRGAATPAAPAPTSGSPQEWLAIAAQKRHTRDYEGARDAYSQLIKLNAMTADAWADYADTIASLSGGSLGGEAEVALQRALSLDSSHPKALWLEATHAYQEHRYTDAVVLWKRLRAVLGPDSPDAKVIDANIAESEQLARAPAG